MAGKTLDLDDILDKDSLACSISNEWIRLNSLRKDVLERWKELRNYIYATDTRHTTNSKLPWSNTTTLPKLTQIRDNLYSNYLATMFPKRKWLDWEGESRSDEDQRKREPIINYMAWAISQPNFKSEAKKLILDYIDTGNPFATVRWVDRRVDEGGGIKSGYVGPEIVRIPPDDIVFNPLASSFMDTPKIVRSIMTIGEAKETIDRMDKTEEEKEIAEEVWKYIMEVRNSSSSWGAIDVINKDEALSVDGFGSFREYLGSHYVELLTFYGDLYDMEKGELLKRHLIVVIDRHKIILKKEHPYPLAEIPIFHVGWRMRQDNLLAMGPLENLVGLQYRLDHIENMKSDLIDLITMPPIQVKGEVSEFEWGPLEKIFTDVDGDVSIKSPDVNALQNNLEIASIEQRMEEMAGSPKEAMGFRTPGEKTAYEVQRLENAGSRIFQNKTSHLEEEFFELLLNAMLVLAKQYLTEATIRVVDDEFNTVDFQEITKESLSANGRLKPIAARHFAEKAERVQNLTNFIQSGLGQDPDISVHFSGLKMAKMVEELLDLEEYDLVQSYVRLSERASAQREANALEEENMMQASTPSGLSPEDATGGFVDQ